jgi:15-cis-phytoene synthase
MSTLAQMSQPFSPTPSQLAVAYSVCRGITRSRAKNFYYGFLVLPKRKRRALCAVYAFMRRCDDIADDPSVPVLERRQKLDLCLNEFHAAQTGHPTDDPVLLALTDAQRRFGIPAGLLDALAFGTAMDVDENSDQSAASGLQVQYGSFEDLQRYCYTVASVVALGCIRIFGYNTPEAEPLAERCGLAFQLTNIIRDVKEDAALGRVYLPGKDLAEFGISATDIAGIDAARIRPLLELEAQRAFENYRAADELIPLINEDSQPALWVLVTIYRSLLEKIVRLNYDVFNGRVSLSVWEKLGILGRGFLQRIY